MKKQSKRTHKRAKLQPHFPVEDLLCRNYPKEKIRVLCGFLESTVDKKHEKGEAAGEEDGKSKVDYNHAHQHGLEESDHAVH